MYYILFLILNVFEVETIKDVEIIGLYRYISTYEIIKKADAIVLGVAFETEDTELGPRQLIKVDNILKGEIKDSIIEYPEHVCEEEIILFLKEVDKKETFLKKDKTFKYDFGYMRNIFQHLKPKPVEEKMEIVRKYLKVLSYPSSSKRAEELSRWYNETEDEGMRYELLEALSLEESKPSKNVMKDVLFNYPSVKHRKYAARAIGMFDEIDDSLDSLLVLALEDSSGEVRSQSLISLSWRRKQWPLPYIKAHLYDTLCCGEALRVLSRNPSFNTDSLLWVVSKVPCEDACEVAIDKIREGIYHWIYLQETQLSSETRDSIISIFKVIPWTSKIKDSLLSFMYNHRYKQISRNAISILGLSKDTTLFPIFSDYIYELKKKLPLLEGDEQKETRRTVGLSIMALGELGDKRAIPLIHDLLIEGIESEPDDRLISFTSCVALKKLKAIEIVPELEKLKTLATDPDTKKRLRLTIEHLTKNL